MWQDEMTEMLRVLVNDPDSTLYDDDKLQKTLAVAAFQVSRELTFAATYTVSVSTVSISPDPTLTATKDESYTNLVCLKAAAIADRGSAILAARRAISVRDGSSAIDLRGPLQGWLALLDKGWGAVYDAAKLDYQIGSSPVAGAAVMGPFRTLITNGTFLFSDEN